MKRVVIRADATLRIASGHIMRCLTLATALKNTFKDIDITLLAGPLPKALEERIGQAKVTLKCLPMNVDSTDWNQSDDIKQSIEAISGLGPIDLIIVDHYSLDIEWERALAPYSQKLLVIDDLINRDHHADFLLDQTFGRKAEEYSARVNQHCQLMLGTNFTLIREEFSRLITQAQHKRQQFTAVHHLLISLGGLDENNATGKILTLLQEAITQGDKEKWHDWSLTIIASSDAPHLSQLKQQIMALPKAKLLIDCQNMAEQLLDADIAIGASGGSAWERCVMGLPTLSVVLADNQIDIATNLAAQGAAINLEHINNLTVARLTEGLAEISSPKVYQKMVQQCSAVCDGRGSSRVIGQLSASEVSLTKATKNDLMTTFTWQSNPLIRKYSRNPKPVSLKEHENWFRHSLKLGTRFLYIIHYQESPCGVLRLDKKDAEHYEVSILVDPSMQGKGVALQALNQIPKQFGDKNIYAFVNPENKASQKLFLKAKFEQISPNEFIRKINADVKN